MNCSGPLEGAVAATLIGIGAVVVGYHVVKAIVLVAMWIGELLCTA